MKRISLTLLLCAPLTSCFKMEGSRQIGTSSRIISFPIQQGISATLNTHSGIHYELGGNGVIYFGGEGQFIIDKESAEGTPLIIDIEGVRLTCEDGEFYLTTYNLVDGPGNGKPGSAKLTVLQGKVRVQNAGPDIIVEKEGVRIFKDSVSTMINWQPEEHTYWANGFYKFKQVPLYECKGILTRWFDLKVGLDANDADSLVRDLYLKPYEEIAQQLHQLEQNNNYTFTFYSKDSITIRHK